MAISRIRFDLKNRSYLEQVVGIGSSQYLSRIDGVLEIPLSKYLRVGMEWDTDKLMLLSDAAVTIFSRGKSLRKFDTEVLTAAGELSYVFGSTNVQSVLDDLYALYLLLVIGVPDLRFYSGNDLLQLLNDVPITSKKDLEDDNFLVKIGASAPSGIPIFLSYSSILRDFHVRLTKNKQLFLTRRLG